MRTFIAALAALALATPGLAEDAARGERLFTNHCAGCHGISGRGDGPLASVLTVPPADLTALNEDSVFPMARVIGRIDGRTEVLAHGGPMPIFGMLLEGPSEAVLLPDGTETVTPEAIADLVAWLVTIQN